MSFSIEAGGVRVGIAAGRITHAERAKGPLCDLRGTLRPGLINAHDHLHRNHYTRMGAPPYANAYEWGRDLHARWPDEIARGRAVPRREALLVGALKNLLSGVTTVVHHDAWEPDFANGFPVRVVHVPHAHSPGFDEAGLATAAVALGCGALDRFMVHLAEGTDRAAADEVHVLERYGLVGPWLLAVHAVGVDGAGSALLRSAGAGVVWCPTSNIFLFGRTCPRSLLDGADVLLGSDSLLTGAGTLLDELRAAHGLGYVDGPRLESAVGDVAAQRLGLPLPRLGPGAPADLVVLRAPLTAAGIGDVALVLVAGEPRVADPELSDIFRLAGVPCREVEVAGVRRVVAAELAAVSSRLCLAGTSQGSDAAATPAARTR